MCFSATASFVAGVSLSVIGVLTLKKVRYKTEIPFAMIPLVFGIQQIIEGMLWLSFRYEVPSLNVVMTYAFTMFSRVLWPIYVPFAVGLVETVACRKNVILLFQFIGLTVGLYLLYLVIKFPVTSAAGQNIVYVSLHFYEGLVMVLYLLATCAGCFFSSHKLIRWFGVLALVLFMVAIWFYTVAFFSVWCFFAAILSAVIYLHFKTEKRCSAGLIQRVA